MQKLQVESASGKEGNRRLAAMTQMQVRSMLRATLDDAAKERWRIYANDWSDRERSYAAASVRGFMKGERSTIAKGSARGER